MSGPGMCGCCGQIVRYWCDTCNYGKGSPHCECGCSNPPRLVSVREVAEHVERASQGGGLMPPRAWYVRERVRVEHRERIDGDTCSYCGRRWSSPARLKRCEQTCDAEAQMAADATPWDDIEGSPQEDGDDIPF